MQRNPKRLLVGGLVLVTLIALAVGFNRDSAPQAQTLDVVNDIQPVSATFADFRTTNNQMASMTAEEMRECLKDTHPNMHSGICYFLRGQQRLPDGIAVEKVDFYFGSADNVRAGSGDGILYIGFIKNQLVAVITVSGSEETITVLVQCMNGAEFTWPEEEMPKNLIAVGTYIPNEHFTISPGEGLIHHVSYVVAIDLAGRHNLSLYQGDRFDPRNLITPKFALTLESNTDREQVTVLVNPGDIFDLVNMTYTPSNPRPNGAG